MFRLSAVVLVGALTACGGEGKGVSTAVKKAELDLSVASRTEAVIDAVTERFRVTVKEQYLEQGMTVRGLVRAASTAKSAKAKAGELDPARFDVKAPSAAKLEVVNGKVIYTAVASGTAEAAAVLSNGGERFTIGYVVEAEVAPSGELRDVVVRQLGSPTRVN